MESMVRQLFDQLHAVGPVDRTRQRRDGKVSFENAASFRSEEIDAVSGQVAALDINSDGMRNRKNTRADQFCVLRNSADGTARPVVAIEYKAPHKLTAATITGGL